MLRHLPGIVSAWFALITAAPGGAPAAAEKATAENAPSTESRLLTLAGEDFRIRETEHFVIAFDTPYRELQSLIGRLEGTYMAVTRFCDNANLPVEPMENPLGVIFYNHHDDFVRFLEQAEARGHGVAGLYDPRSNTAAFCSTRANPAMEPLNREIERLQQQLQRPGRNRSTDPLRRQLSALRAQRSVIVERFNRLVIQHEAAHHVLFNLGIHRRGAHAPRWLAEGLACQFEVPQPALSQGELQINHVRLADLRDALGVDPRAQEASEAQYLQAVQSRRLVPLPELVTEADTFHAAADNLLTRYAQAWSLVYYLHQEHAPAFTEYVTALAARESGETVTTQAERDTFEARFGPLDDAFQRRWLEYTLRLRLDPDRAGR